MRHSPSSSSPLLLGALLLFNALLASARELQAVESASQKATLRALLNRRWECPSIDMEASGKPWSDMSPRQCALRMETIKLERDLAVRRRTGLIFFHHIHKAGGTTLCEIAKNNMRCDRSVLPRKQDWNTNCVPIDAFQNWHPRLVPYQENLKGGWVGGNACWFADLSITQQRSVRGKFPKLQFIASEGSLPDKVYLGAGYSYITMLRDPLDRALSSYYWWQTLSKQVKRHGGRYSSLCGIFYAPYNSTYDDFLDYYADNWLTRSYAGRAAMYMNRQVTEAEFMIAINRLHYFSAVLIMEQFGESMEILRAQFGFHDVDVNAHREGSKRNSKALEELKDFPELIEKVKRLHYWDTLLYEYAEVLFQNQLALARKKAGNQYDDSQTTVATGNNIVSSLLGLVGPGSS